MERGRHSQKKGLPEQVVRLLTPIGTVMQQMGSSSGKGISGVFRGQLLYGLPLFGWCNGCCLCCCGGIDSDTSSSAGLPGHYSCAFLLLLLARSLACFSPWLLLLPLPSSFERRHRALGSLISKRACIGSGQHGLPSLLLFSRLHDFRVYKRYE